MRAAASPRALFLTLVAAAVVATGLVAVQTVAAAPAAAAVPPGSSLTGVAAGSKLTRVDGFLVLNRAGATYRNLDIHGRVRIMAPNITLENSIVRGDASTVFGSLVDCNNPGANHNGFVLRNSELVASKPSIYQDGILGHDFTVVGSEIRGTVDAVKIVGSNVTVSRSYLHDTVHIPASSSPNHQETHNDGVQITAGTNITISSNIIQDNSNAGLMITQGAGTVSNVRFTGNWSSGGACTVNITATPRPTISGLTVTGNQFKHNTRVANCAILQNRGVAMTLGGNIWQGNGVAVALTRGA